MTRKSRVFSALAIAAAGALMITTTAYQSRAADDIHIDPGTGYAGSELAAVTGLSTTSSGTFRYDAPGTDEDIEIASGDIKSLETAVKALSQQVVGLGDTAKAADMAIESGLTDAVNTASTNNLAAINELKNTTNTINTKVGTLSTSAAVSDLQNAVDALNTKYETLSNTVNTINTKVSDSNSISLSNILSGAIRTASGYADADGILHLKGSELISRFSRDQSSGGTGYLIWAGNYTAEQLKSKDYWGLNYEAKGTWNSIDAHKGFLGVLSYADTFTVTSGYVGSYNYLNVTVGQVDDNSVPSRKAVIPDSAFTLAPVLLTF